MKAALQGGQSLTRSSCPEDIVVTFRANELYGLELDSPASPQIVVLATTFTNDFASCTLKSEIQTLLRNAFDYLVGKLEDIREEMTSQGDEMIII